MKVGGDQYIESVYIGKLAPEPPAGTMRYFEFYVPTGRNSGSAYGFKTNAPGLGGPDEFDEEEIIQLALAAGVSDAAHAAIVKEISEEQARDQYEHLFEDKGNE